MKSYRSENKARRAIDEDEQFFIDNVYCPLIKDKCNPYCVCFKRPAIKKEKEAWKVVGNILCGNYMLHGD